MHGLRVLTFLKQSLILAAVVTGVLTGGVASAAAVFCLGYLLCYLISRMTGNLNWMFLMWSMLIVVPTAFTMGATFAGAMCVRLLKRPVRSVPGTGFAVVGARDGGPSFIARNDNA